jgi:hypothetical protein
MIELTIFAKSQGSLTKKISLAPDGSVHSDGSHCVMTHGRARRFAFTSMDALAEEINRLASNEALTLGRLRPDLPAEVEVVTKSKLNGASHPGIIARSQEHLVYPEGAAAMVLLDFDTKGMPPSVDGKLVAAGGFWPALVSVVKELEGTARIERASTSAGLYDERTGEAFPGSGGRHTYVLVKDGSDNERFLKTLHARCWLAGFGWMMVGAGGQLLDRSIVDRVVGSPERLAFEGAPILTSSLAQDKTARIPLVVDGEPFDTLLACPPLTIVELARLRELRAKQAHELAGDCAKARDAFVEYHAPPLAERTGLTLQRARKTIERQCEGVLLPDLVLPFDDPDLAGKTVADALADPDRFEGETLADPVEGIEYGRCKARIMRRADGSLWINSFAHGRTVYELKLDYRNVKAALDRGGSR